MKIFQAKKIPKLSKFIFSSNLQNYFLRNSPGCPRFWATWKLFLSRLVVIESFPIAVVGAVQFWSLRTYSLWRASEMTLHGTCPHRRKLAHSMHMHSCLKRLQLSGAARAWTISLGHLESIQNSLVAVDSSTGGFLFCFLLGIFVCTPKLAIIHIYVRGIP